MGEVAPKSRRLAGSAGLERGTSRRPVPPPTRGYLGRDRIVRRKRRCASVPATLVVPPKVPLSPTPPEKPGDLLRELVTTAGIRQETINATELSQGFCNYVWFVAPTKDSPPVVAKVYSPLHEIRTEKKTWGAVDRVASEKRLGPKVVFETTKGVIYEFLPGRVLKDEDMTNPDILNPLALKLADLHSCRVPREFARPKEPLIWHFLYSMLGEIERLEETSAFDKDTLPTFFRSDVLRAEINECQSAIQKLNLPVVLGHGDCKPANAMINQPRHQQQQQEEEEHQPQHHEQQQEQEQQHDDGFDHHQPEVMLIDFELSGPNYRGYDIMKLFRKLPKASQEAPMRDFLGKYAQQQNIPEGKERETFVDDLLEECRRIEPLTWLEAVTFFALIVHIKPDQQSEWIRLGTDRWTAHLESKTAMLS